MQCFLVHLLLVTVMTVIFTGNFCVESAHCHVACPTPASSSNLHPVLVAAPIQPVCVAASIGSRERLTQAGPAAAEEILPPPSAGAV